MAINISKLNGKTIVAISDNGIANIVSYDVAANIHSSGNQILIVSNGAVLLSFPFSEVENPQGATNASEYVLIMSSNGYFASSSSGSGGSSSPDLSFDVLNTIYDGIINTIELPTEAIALISVVVNQTPIFDFTFDKPTKTVTIDPTWLTENDEIYLIYSKPNA